MSENLPISPPWDLIAKKNAGVATLAELAVITQWLVQNAPPVAEGLDQIDITFADEAAMVAWLRLQQRSKRLAMTGTSWLVAYENTLLPITAAEVAHFTSHPGHVTLTTLRGQTYTVALSLDELEATVEPRHFLRANQRTLLARAGIASAEPLSDGSLLVHLQPAAQQKVVVSKEQAVAFSTWFSSI